MKDTKYPIWRWSMSFLKNLFSSKPVVIQEEVIQEEVIVEEEIVEEVIVEEVIREEI
jgi:hypothetical protein